MYTAQDIIHSFQSETEIFKHLASKIPADQYEYRPAEWMRSIRELLEYTARMGIAPIELIENGYNPEVMKQMRLDTEARDVKTEYVDMMEEQLEKIAAYLVEVSQEHLDEKVELLWSRQPRKVFFLEIAIKNFPAYRMQLFQYLKAGLGIHDLKTENLWMGKDS